MNPESSSPSAVTAEQVDQVLSTVAAQVQIAMQLSATTLLTLFMVAAFAFNFKKTGLVFAVIWGVVTSMIPNGYSLLVGPLTSVLALVILVQSFVKTKGLE